MEPNSPDIAGATPPNEEDNIEKSVPQAEQVEFSMTGKLLNENAKAATALEHSMTLWEGIKLHRKAVFWSVIVSSSIIMEGYDTTLIGSFYGYPMFQKKYGELTATSGYQLTTPWMTGIGDIQSVGNLIGALLNGYFTQKYGHRKVMLVNLVLMTGFVFITFFAQNITMLLIGAFLCSIPWGVFATMGPAYAAEVCPLVLRGYLTAFVNLCWAIGQLLSAAILKGLVTNTTQWSYRIPFAVQWIWPIPLFIAGLYCPESPWFLVRQNRLDEAENSLRRLSSQTTTSDTEHKQTIALMVHTTRLEEEEMLGTSYWDCFKGTNLRRTEIACFAFLAQITDGGAFAYSPMYFFEQAGISSTVAYDIGLGGTCIAFCGTVISWFIMSRVGRRKIFLAGFCVLVFCLYLIAILACIPGSTHNMGIMYTQAALCLVWLGVYSMTAGPIVYTIVAEIGATRLRSKTVLLGRSTYYVGNIIGGVMEPYMMNPTAWNWKGKTAFFWGTLSLITTIWAYFRLPETKDRTFEELDILFIRGVKSRHFAEVNMDSDEDYTHND